MPWLIGEGGLDPRSLSENPQKTYLAFMPGRLLARNYGEHGQRLLERNLRAFLQVKGKVNKGLQQTLEEEPHRFLAYNNGLCCTAAEVRLENRPDGRIGLAWARDFQIVNGGQTTAGIYHAMKKERLDISQVVVQVKLTVLRNPDRIADVVPLIAKYANSQNKVNATDLAANGTFHQGVERLSRTVWTPPPSAVWRAAHAGITSAPAAPISTKPGKGRRPVAVTGKNSSRPIRSSPRPISRNLNTLG